MSDTPTSAPTEPGAKPNEAVVFVRKWAATIAYIVLFITQAYVTNRLSEQNQRIEDLVEKNAQEDCSIRKETRDTLRNVLFGIMDHFPPNDDIEALREYVQDEYPPLDCPEKVT